MPLLYQKSMILLIFCTIDDLYSTSYYVLLRIFCKLLKADSLYIKQCNWCCVYWPCSVPNMSSLLNVRKRNIVLLFAVIIFIVWLIIIVECPCFNAGADWVTLVAIFNCQMSTEVCLSNLGSEASVCVCVHLQIFSLTIEPSTSSVGLECNSWILIVLWIHRLTEACWSELRIGCWRLCLLFLLHLL